jgi:hypothetical protein
VQAHPPQRPGALSETDCWALTAFLWHENGRLPSDGHLGPALTEHSVQRVGISVAVILGVLLVAGMFTRSRAL